MEKKWQMVLALIAGVAIGLHWEKIKKISLPITKKIGERSIDACAGTIRFLAEQKERLEDMRAAARSRQQETLVSAVSEAKGKAK